MKKILAILSLLIFTATFSNITFAGEAQSKVEQLITGFKNYKKGNSGSVKNIEKVLNLDFMAQRSMNFHWPKMSDNEKKEFLDIFKKLVEKMAYEKSGTYFKNNKYTFVSEKRISKKDYLLSRKKEKLSITAVKLKVDYKTGTGIKKENIVFYLIKRPEGLVVFDVELLDGSLVKDYRNQFSRTKRKKGGIKGLINSMKDKYNE